MKITSISKNVQWGPSHILIPFIKEKPPQLKEYIVPVQPSNSKCSTCIEYVKYIGLKEPHCTGNALHVRFLFTYKACPHRETFLGRVTVRNGQSAVISTQGKSGSGMHQLDILYKTAAAKMGKSNNSKH